MKALFLLLVLLIAACGGDANETMETYEYDNAPLAMHTSTEPTPTPMPAPTPIQYRQWSIEELGAIIVAGGNFWEDWWHLRGPFDREHIGQETGPRPWDYAQLLPASGFESLYDIRYYLLQYYTQELVDLELHYRWSLPFQEYNGNLLINVHRWGNPRPNWDTATHVLVRQYGNYAVVDTTVLVAAWHWEGIDPMEHAWEATIRFSFRDGRINSPDQDTLYNLTVGAMPRPAVDEIQQEWVGEPGELQWEYAPLIPEITIYARGAPGTDTKITFTDVYDISYLDGHCGLAITFFYVAPTGTISVNRDIYLAVGVRFNAETGWYETVYQAVAAGEIISVYEHSGLYFYCDPLQSLSWPYTMAKRYMFIIVHDPDRAPRRQINGWSWTRRLCGCVWPGHCRVSNHAAP